MLGCWRPAFSLAGPLARSPQRDAGGVLLRRRLALPLRRVFDVVDVREEVHDILAEFLAAPLAKLVSFLEPVHFALKKKYLVTAHFSARLANLAEPLSRCRQHGNHEAKKPEPEAVFVSFHATPLRRPHLRAAIERNFPTK